MDILTTSLAFLPLRFARNQVTYTIDAAPDSIKARQDLVYYLCLKTPVTPGSGEYSELITIPGRELPKRTEFGVDIYPGATFDAAVYLDDYLKRVAPAPDQAVIMACPDQITPFVANVLVKNAGVLVAGTDSTLPIEYAIKGALSVDEFAGWSNQFFTTYLADTRTFLTWQPAEKWVETNQPEFLYYLVNFTPLPTELWLTADIAYTDGSVDTGVVLLKATAVSQYTIYSMPVGFSALGLADRETTVGKQVLSYQVWVSNQSAQRLSEVRTYYVNRDYEPNTLFLLFANSLGGYDTLRCTGQTSRTLTVKGTSAQRALAPDYLPTSSELFSRDRKGEKVLQVNTGLLDGDVLDYLSELTLTEEIYVAVQEGFVALVPTNATLNLHTDDENLAGRTFSFQYAKNEVGFSGLPAAPAAVVRTTRWAPINTFCQINENGVRTGLMGAAQLELRYADDGSLVKPRRVKANQPGTEGYQPASTSSACLASTTPFLNMAISQAGTFRRNNCATDEESTVATIAILAGTYGAETALQLQSRIDTAIAVMDTQAYANLYGSCLANPAAYSYAVPANRWHFRTNVPARIGIETLDAPYMGNAWTMQGRGTYVYPTGSNDLDFPSAGFSGYQFRIFMYGIAYAPAKLRLYKNGVLYREDIFTFNLDSYQYTNLFSLPAGGYLSMADGDKLYVQLIDL